MSIFLMIIGFFLSVSSGSIEKYIDRKKRNKEKPFLPFNILDKLASFVVWFGICLFLIGFYSMSIQH